MPSRQAVGQGPPCIGDRRTVQHPRAADLTHPPWHATALPGQPLAGPWGHFRARKSIEGAAMHQGKPSAQHPSGRGGVRDRKSATSPSETPQAARCAAPEPDPASRPGDTQAMLSSQATPGLRHRGSLAGHPCPSRTGRNRRPILGARFHLGLLPGLLQRQLLRQVFSPH